MKRRLRKTSKVFESDLFDATTKVNLNNETETILLQSVISEIGDLPAYNFPSTYDNGRTG